MSNTAPWSTLAASPVAKAESLKSPRSPMSLQEIMDEALALKLYEEECQALEEKPVAEGVWSDLETKPSARELYGADWEGDDDDGDVGQVPWTRSAASTTATKPKEAKPRLERSNLVEGASSGLVSIRETMRRWDKDARRSVQSGSRVEKAHFATQDSVLDPKTTLMLQKLINRGDLDEVYGCVQSGKEANVYFARGTDEDTLQPRQYAVKIFRSTLNSFGNRHEYVTGDRRFDLAFQKKDARRQLKEWTEKEFRNLSRAAKYIRAPAPLTVKEHIVVMRFIGDSEGHPAPTLKEAKLSHAQLQHAYVDLLVSIRKLFHQAKLVHGDLSEYNVLYQHQKCWLIDFGQAVDRTHPEFLTYLRRDLHNVFQFFQRRGLTEATSEESSGILSEDMAFEFVTREEDAYEVLHAFPELHALFNEKS
ncbi:hypothetical protein Poli38472_013385 [Pythium oligandrum]|uniref:non-specific serine/threonine protein kinase n=1 Tax=Pythium oligandrum TaxID=41045 RepID=A0A8K1C7N3_PYTOL|nr:hypothetical protein Poli38472_013385 [Pythium oligandrum]|eukprot:TMW57911.1 hypothetical protein Poli38472_013385 [Pythium oligandrum]